jgi:hypothetical protein
MNAAHTSHALTFDRSARRFMATTDEATTAAIPTVKAQPSHVTGVAP